MSAKLFGLYFGKFGLANGALAELKPFLQLSPKFHGGAIVAGKPTILPVHMQAIVGEEELRQAARKMMMKAGMHLPEQATRVQAVRINSQQFGPWVHALEEILAEAQAPLTKKGALRKSWKFAKATKTFKASPIIRTQTKLICQKLKSILVTAEEYMDAFNGATTVLEAPKGASMLETYPYVEKEVLKEAGIEMPEPEFPEMPMDEVPTEQLEAEHEADLAAAAIPAWKRAADKAYKAQQEAEQANAAVRSAEEAFILTYGGAKQAWAVKNDRI